MTKKKQQVFAKLIFKESLNSQGFIDPQKVRQVLAKISLYKKDTIKILKIYKRLIQRAQAKEEIIIEAAEKIKLGTKVSKAILTKTGAAKIRYIINPKIVFGAWLTHGDWIWDATLGAKLARLTQND